MGLSLTLTERKSRHFLCRYLPKGKIAKHVAEAVVEELLPYKNHVCSITTDNGTEFAEHKIYNTGESTKHIDWKLFAKTDKLYTKRYEEETNLRCTFLVDQSQSIGFATLVVAVKTLIVLIDTQRCSQ